MLFINTFEKYSLNGQPLYSFVTSKENNHLPNKIKIQPTMRTIIILAISLCIALSSFAQSNEAKKAYNKALNQYNAKNYDFAIPYLEEALSSSPDFADAIHMLAVCYDERGDYAQSINNYKKVVQYKPDDEKAWYNLGQLYVATKQDEKALVALKKATALKPNYAKAQREIALLESKKSEKAVTVNSTAQADGTVKTTKTKKTIVKKSTDRSQNASIYAAVNLYKEGKYQESLGALYNVKKSNATAKTWYMRGLCYEKLGDEKDALDAYEKAVSKDPEYYKALTRIGVLNFNAGNFEPAYQAFTTSSQIKEDQKITYVAGQAAYHSENYGVAISLLGAATEEQPQNGEAFFYLANAYRKNGNMSMYKQHLDIAADLGYDKAVAARARVQSSKSKQTIVIKEETTVITTRGTGIKSVEQMHEESAEKNARKPKNVRKAVKERKARERKKEKYNGVSEW